MNNRRRLRLMIAFIALATMSACGAREAIDRGMSKSAESYQLNPNHAILVWNYDALPETARFCPLGENGAITRCPANVQIPVISGNLPGFNDEMAARRSSAIIRGEGVDYRVFSTPVPTPGRYAFVGAYQQSLKTTTKIESATYVIDAMPGTVVVIGNGMAGEHSKGRESQTLERARQTFIDAFGERAQGLRFVLADFKQFKKTAAAQ